VTSHRREDAVESIELNLIEMEFYESQDRSWKRRRAVQHRRVVWTVFWAVIVLGAWIAVGLWALGVIHI